jgi:hypothetical protein
MRPSYGTQSRLENHQRRETARINAPTRREARRIARKERRQLGLGAEIDWSLLTTAQQPAARQENL